MLYPRRSVMNTLGKIVAVCNNSKDIPVYQNITILDDAELISLAKSIQGYVMQQDDGWTPPFTLYNFRA